MRASIIGAAMGTGSPRPLRSKAEIGIILRMDAHLPDVFETW